MAQIDYNAIVEGLRSTIASGIAPTFQDATVVSEAEFTFADQWIGVYLRDRAAPESDQMLSAGKRTRFRVALTVSVWAFGQTWQIAAQRRNALLAALDTAIMSDRTLGGTLEGGCWIEGGDFKSGADPKDGRKFWAWCDSRVVGFASAITS